MPRKLKERDISDPTARGRLPAGTHWRSIDIDVHLGFRKREKGDGVWLVRWYKGRQKYWHHEFGIADGRQEQDGVRVLNYKDAMQIALVWVDGEKARVIAEMQGPAITVKGAIEAYVVNLTRRQQKKGVVSKNQPGGQLAKHVLLDDKFSALPLYDLTTDDLRDWRNRLEKGLTAQGKPYVLIAAEN